MLSTSVLSLTHTNYISIHSLATASRRTSHAASEANWGTTSALFLGGDASHVYIGKEKQSGDNIEGHTYIDSEKITLGNSDSSTMVSSVLPPPPPSISAAGNASLLLPALLLLLLLLLLLAMST